MLIFRIAHSFVCLPLSMPRVIPDRICNATRPKVEYIPRPVDAEDKIILRRWMHFMGKA
jgi:hypothetical protein